MGLLDLLLEMVPLKASDLYLLSGETPRFRIRNQLQSSQYPPVTADQLRQQLEKYLGAAQLRAYQDGHDQNFALDLSGHRFRINAYFERHQPALVARRIESHLPSLDNLALPQLLGELTLENNGLILLVGPTGSGKSTTLAALLNYRNSNRSGHILTLEDPIEFHHPNQQSIISQREIGLDVPSYQLGLKSALRQKPDVIMVGEIRDREVMEQALRASETGHLCFSTLHAASAAQTLERICNFFPANEHPALHYALAGNLTAVIAQKLLPGKAGQMVLALEIMLNIGAIRDLIAKGEFHAIANIMDRSQGSGQQTMDQALFAAYQQDKISPEMAIAHAALAADMQIRIRNHQNSQIADNKLDLSHLALANEAR